MIMFNDGILRVEVITGVAGRRYWPAHEKPRILEERLAPWLRDQTRQWSAPPRAGA